MPRCHHRTHKIESLEAMILMSGSTADGIADADVDLPTGGTSFGLAGNSEAFTTGGVSFDPGFQSGFEFSGTGESASEGGGATGSQSADDQGGMQFISGNNPGSVVDTTAVNTDGELPPAATANGSLAAASGAGNGVQIIQGTDNAEWLSVANGSARVTAGAGNDSLHSSLNDSVLDGGDGFDTFYVYEGTSADFTIQQTDSGVIVSGVGVNGGTVANTLINVERIVFNDREIDLTILPSSVTQPTLASQILGVPGFFGGSPTDDMIDGTNGADEFYASAGNDQIDGGDGSDTLYIYGGTYLNPLGAPANGIQPAVGFTVNRISADTVVVEGTTASGESLRYELTNVERIVFDTQTVYLDGPGYKTLTGTSAAEWLATDECTDFVYAGEGDDTIFRSTSGVRLVNGGDGIDTLVIYKDSADFQLVDLRDSFGAWWVIGDGSVVDLVDVEFIQFNDQRIATVDIPPPAAGVGFGRAAVILPPICFHV